MRSIVSLAFVKRHRMEDVGIELHCAACRACLLRWVLPVAAGEQQHLAPLSFYTNLYGFCYLMCHTAYVDEVMCQLEEGLTDTMDAWVQEEGMEEEEEGAEGVEGIEIDVKQGVQCPSCHVQCVGEIKAIGPHGETCLTFGRGKTYLLATKGQAETLADSRDEEAHDNVVSANHSSTALQGKRDTKLRRWASQVRRFPWLLHRSPETFYTMSSPAASQDHVDTKERYTQRLKLAIRRTAPKTRHPTYQDLMQLDLTHLVSHELRPYQRELFFQAFYDTANPTASSLQPGDQGSAMREEGCGRGGAVFYLPTGAGKTLIAVTIMATMHHYNPRKQCIFLVDRVPLVFQQGLYVEQQTGLRVAALCGETLFGRRNDFESTEYDVIVVTASVLIGMLAEGVMTLAQVSCLIMDECHHATGRHPYAILLRDYLAPLDALEEARGTANAYRPRFVALSASPIVGHPAEHKMPSLLETFLKVTLPACHVFTPAWTWPSLADVLHPPTITYVHVAPTKEDLWVARCLLRHLEAWLCATYDRIEHCFPSRSHGTSQHVGEVNKLVFIQWMP